MQTKAGPENRSNSPARNEDLKCWKTGSNPHCLRIELSEGTQFLLPYGYFEGATFVRKADVEILQIQFKAHQFSIKGKALDELFFALQALSVDWLREITPRYRHLQREGMGLVEKIEIADSVQAEI